MDYAPASFIVAASVAALLIGLSKGGLSLMGALGVPILALVISPVKAAALLLPILVISDMVGLWLYRREFDRRNLAILIGGGVIGIGIGWMTASLVSDRMVAFMIGLIGIVFCVNTWRRRHTTVAPQSAQIPRGIFWGTVMGFSSFVSHSGGPPYQVYVLPQQLPKTVYAGTTTIVFAAINAVKLLPYWVLGQLSPANLRTSVYLMPIAIAGTFAGVKLVRVLPQRSYFLFVQSMMLIVSIKLVADAFAK
jgi:uncharacterized membrane protein YfcA